jgi:hypothetical protein
MALYKVFSISGGNQNGPSDQPPDRTGAISFQAVWSGVDALDATVEMQWSNDGATWEQIPSLIHTLSTASGSTSFNINVVNHSYYRAVLAVGTATNGTINIYVNA